MLELSKKEISSKIISNALPAWSKESEYLFSPAGVIGEEKGKSNSIDDFNQMLFALIAIKKGSIHN